MCAHVFQSSRCTAYILELVLFVWMKMCQSLHSVFWFSFAHLHKIVFFHFFFFLNLDLPKVGGSVHLKLSRPLPSQQSNLIIRADEIQLDIFVTDECNVVEEGWNYISPPITYWGVWGAYNISLETLTLCVLLDCGWTLWVTLTFCGDFLLC